MIAESVYVHIPFCKARCGYCAFCSCTDFSLQKKYIELLCGEIDRAKTSVKSPIKTMYWGGGTPSCVDLKYLRMLFDKLCGKFDFSNLHEFTVECNPESTTEELLSFLKSIGVNRLSFGLQSVHDETLKRIGRLHSYAGFLHALDMALKHDFVNINADLILGLPENPEQFQKSIQTVAELPLKHLSLYSIELHDGNTAFNNLYKSYNFDDDQLADLYDYALAYFEKKGFARYEVSNFAKDGYASEHNLAYWQEKRYYGFGASASGFIDNTRYGNACDLQTYINTDGNFLEYCDNISGEEEIKEYVMLGLRLTDGIDVNYFEKRFGCSFFLKFKAAESLIQNGYLNFSNGKIAVARDKFYVLNSILVELL